MTRKVLTAVVVSAALLTSAAQACWPHEESPADCPTVCEAPRECCGLKKAGLAAAVALPILGVVGLVAGVLRLGGGAGGA